MHKGISYGYKSILDKRIPSSKSREEKVYVRYKIYIKNERYKLRQLVGTPKLSTFSTEVHSFDLGATFLTFASLKNVNCKRNETFKSCKTYCIGGYESIHAASERLI